MLVYLASPIDLCGSNPDLNQVREQLITELSMQGAAVYAPNRAWSLDIDQTGADELDRLSDINFYALNQADLVLALAPPGVPSVGVPIEVYHALLHDSRVALWFGVPKNDRIGAMWTHLVSTYPDQIRLIPATITGMDVKKILDWVIPELVQTNGSVV